MRAVILLSRTAMSCRSVSASRRSSSMAAIAEDWAKRKARDSPICCNSLSRLVNVSASATARTKAGSRSSAGMPSSVSRLVRVCSAIRCAFNDCSAVLKPSSAVATSFSLAVRALSSSLNLSDTEAACGPPAPLLARFSNLLLVASRSYV